jgi:tetratricopeptide (TPR) repeat protein
LNKVLVFQGFLVLVLFTGILPQLAYGSPATVYLTSTSLTINFDKPKDSVSYFEVNGTLNLVNNGNESVTVSKLNVSFLEVSGISASVAQGTFVLSGGDSEQVNVTFRVNSSLAEKTYDGKLSISGNNVNTKEESVSIRVIHPPATIKATWEDGWGNVKAGSNFTKTLRVAESMGYKGAKNVSIVITHQGPAILKYTSFLGDFIPYENKTLKINVSIPSRGIIPGTYPLRITVSSPTNISAVVGNASYIIPTPQMVLSGTTIDLGKITFESGKESSEGLLVVQEIGGYTPIEGLKISLASGEMGWITYHETNYIPPGGTERYTFKVFLPQDGTLGEKTWRYILSTSYAGTRDLLVKVLVYFPGVEEALAYIRSITGIPEYPESKTIITGTINLLEKTKGTVDTKKIVSVMSIYSGARTFLNNIEDAVKNRARGNLVAAGDSIIRAHRSLTKMKVGEENLDSEFKATIKDGITSADTVWKRASEDTLKDLKIEALKARESNYKFAVIYYKRISQIYDLQGNEVKAEEYSLLQKEMEGLYEEYLTYATENKTFADSEKKKALEKTFRIKDVSFVLNPLSYESVSAGLENAISAYEEAEKLYRFAGEIEDADLLSNKILTLKKQLQGIKRAFMAYGLFLVALLVGFLVRTSLALQHYRLDEEEGTIGDIVMEGEEKIER